MDENEKIGIPIDEKILHAIAERVAEINSKKIVTTPIVPLIEKQYSIKDVEAFTGRERQSIISHIKKDLLIASKKGKTYLISHSNLQKYLSNNE